MSLPVSGGLLKSPRYAGIILGALALGTITGILLHSNLPTKHAIDATAHVFSVAADVFLRLIKMVIGPLIFATLIGGIAHLGDGKSVARMGLKALLWFFIASLVSLGIGACVALTLQPGNGLHLIPPVMPVDTGLKGRLSAEAIILHAFPTSIVDALAANEILQIVIFSLFAGVALGSLGQRGATLLRAIDELSVLMLAITNYVMMLAPVGVFAAIASVVAQNGIGVLVTFGTLIGAFYAALAVLCAILLVAGRLVIGTRVWRLVNGLRAPALVAFSTSSSEAAYPSVLEALESFGVSRKVAGFVMPLGYSFNLDASMMYCTFGALFIAQAYGMHLSARDVTVMLFMLMLTSKGIAAVPRGALIAIAGVLPYFSIPDSGILLLLGVDHFMNMGRSVTNVLGNALATAAVARWEGDDGADSLDAAAVHPSECR